MEFPDLGCQCDVDDCKQLDFLPFGCDACKGVFCVQHKCRDAHNCTANNGSQISDPGPAAYCKESLPCSLKECQSFQLTLVSCSLCGKEFCLRHRHPQDHACSALDDVKEERSVNTSRTSTRCNVDPSSRGRVGKKSSATTAKVLIMKLKMKAVGNNSVPQSERIYFTAVYPEESNKIEVVVFLSKYWTIGRIIDELASLKNIPNTNNRINGKNLRLYASKKVELPSDVRLEDALEQSSFGLQEGEKIYLHYVS